MENEMNINLADVPNIACENCGGEFFKEACVIKRMSPLMSPNGQESIIPVGTFICVSCSHVNARFLPPGTTNKRKSSLLVTES